MRSLDLISFFPRIALTCILPIVLMDWSLPSPSSPFLPYLLSSLETFCGWRINEDDDGIKFSNWKDKISKQLNWEFVRSRCHRFWHWCLSMVSGSGQIGVKISVWWYQDSNYYPFYWECPPWTTWRFIIFLKKSGPTPASFLFVFDLFKHIITEKIVGFKGIWTRIVGEGEHAYHLTTTTIPIPIHHF